MFPKLQFNIKMWLLSKSTIRGSYVNLITASEWLSGMLFRKPFMIFFSFSFVKPQEGELF